MSEKYKYENRWKELEGTQLTENRVNSYISSLETSLEKTHLYEIAKMLKEENFVPEDFWLLEYPIAGAYICERIGDTRGIDYFCIVEVDGILQPHYTTNDFVDKVNQFPCLTIKESIEKMEC